MNIRLVLLLLSIFIVVVFPRTLKRSKRIIGGSAIRNETHWPWLVRLRGRVQIHEWFTTKQIEVTCGASLLSEYWAITAAHCFEEQSGVFPQFTIEIGAKHNPSERKGKIPKERKRQNWTWFSDFIDWFSDRRGSYIDLSLSGRSRRRRRLGPNIWRTGISKIVKHPGYTGEVLWDHDIALVKLTRPAPLHRSSVNAARLPVYNGDVTFLGFDKKCYVAGWGCTRKDDDQPSDYARQVELSLWQYSKCQKLYGGDDQLGLTKLCAGGRSIFESKGVCLGDSGGPLVCQNNEGKFMLVGVVSFGKENYQTEAPTVFTRVAKYRRWIDSVILK